MEVLRRPDYEIITQHLLAAAVVLAQQLLKEGYALADLWGDPSGLNTSNQVAKFTMPLHLYPWRIIFAYSDFSIWTLSRKYLSLNTMNEKIINEKKKNIEIEHDIVWNIL